MATVVNLRGHNPFGELASGIGKGIETFARIKRKEKEREEEQEFRRQERIAAEDHALNMLTTRAALETTRDRTTNQERRDKLKLELEQQDVQQTMADLATLNLEVPEDLIRASAQVDTDAYIRELTALPIIPTVTPEAARGVVPFDPEGIQQQQQEVIQERAAIGETPIGEGNSMFFLPTKDVPGYTKKQLENQKMQEEVIKLSQANEVHRQEQKRINAEETYRTSTITRIARDIHDNGFYSSFIPTEIIADPMKRKDFATAVYDKAGGSLSFFLAMSEKSKGGFVNSKVPFNELRDTDFSPTIKRGFIPATQYWQKSKFIQDAKKETLKGPENKQHANVQSYLTKLRKFNSEGKMHEVYMQGTNFERLDEWARNMEAAILAQNFKDRMENKQGGILATLESSSINTTQAINLSSTVVRKYQDTMLNTNQPNNGTIDSHSKVMDATASLMLDRLKAVVEDGTLAEQLKKDVNSGKITQEVATLVKEDLQAHANTVEKPEPILSTINQETEILELFNLFNTMNIDVSNFDVVDAIAEDYIIKKGVSIEEQEKFKQQVRKKRTEFLPVQF